VGTDYSFSLAESSSIMTFRKAFQIAVKFMFKLISEGKIKHCLNIQIFPHLIKRGVPFRGNFAPHYGSRFFSSGKSSGVKRRILGANRAITVNSYVKCRFGFYSGYNKNFSISIYSFYGKTASLPPPILRKLGRRNREQSLTLFSAICSLFPLAIPFHLWQNRTQMKDYKCRK
jgi:hypothetical protein